MTSLPVESQNQHCGSNEEISSGVQFGVRTVESTSATSPLEVILPDSAEAPSIDTLSTHGDDVQQVEVTENGLPSTSDEHPDFRQVEFSNVTVSDHNDTAETTLDSDADPLRVTCLHDERAARIPNLQGEDPLNTSKDADLEKPPTTARRKSHLRLDIRPSSPQPWELVDPPTHYSPGASQKKRTFQHSTFEAQSTRPLIPKSSYYFGPPPSDAAFGTPPVGQIGVHHPREVIRIERDYTGGELTQFAPIYPLELEGRITPTHFLESINAINELLISAHSIRHSFWDNVLSIFTLQLSKLILTSHYEREMNHLEHLFEELNSALYNPVGLNLLWPRDVAFLYLEIEYY